MIRDVLARFLYVCLGGALGSAGRYATALAAVALLGPGFPYGTLIVNLIGSFFIGVVMELVPMSDVRLFLVTGVLGGFTTYSSFNEETLRMLRDGLPGGAAINVLATVAGCMAAGTCGFLVARMFR
jgi:fluoride exporter